MKNLKELRKELAKAIKDAEGSEESEASAEENALTIPTSMPRMEREGEKKKKVRKANHSIDDEAAGDWVEASNYEMLEESYQVQRCITGKDKAYDNAYNTDMTTKDDHQCTNVETPNWYTEEKVNNDATCTDVVELDRKRDKITKNDEYGQKGGMHDRKPTQNCYSFPRKIQVEVCKTDVQRYCEKFSNIFPFLVEEQNCHSEPTRICKLEMKNGLKKTKKYSHTKEQPREICDRCDIQSLCDNQEMLTRTFKPVDTCNKKAVLRRLVDVRIHSFMRRPGSGLSIGAVDLEEQTVEVIETPADTNRVIIKVNKAKKNKEKENWNTAEDGLGYKMRERDDKADEALGAGAYGEKETTFLTQATSGNVNATQLFDKNWMGRGADDSYITSC